MIEIVLELGSAVANTSVLLIDILNARPLPVTEYFYTVIFYSSKGFEYFFHQCCILMQQI